jgi:hypothetical protein
MKHPLNTPGDYVMLVSAVRGRLRLYQATDLLELNYRGEPQAQGMLVFKLGLMPSVRGTLFDLLGIKPAEWSSDYADAIEAFSTVTDERLAAFWTIVAFSDKTGWKDFSAVDPCGLAVAHLILTVLPWLMVDIELERQLNALALRAQVRGTADLIDARKSSPRLYPHRAGALARNLAAVVADGDPANTDAFRRFADSAPLTPAELEISGRIVYNTTIPGRGTYLHSQRQPEQRRAYVAAVGLLFRRYGYKPLAGY